MAGLFLFAAFGLKKRYIFIPLVIAGGLYAAWRHQPPPSFAGGHFEAALEGYASVPVRRRFGFSQSFTVKRFAILNPADPKKQKLPPFNQVRIYTEYPFRPGRLYRIKAKLSLPPPRLDPGAPDFPLRPGAQVQRSISCGTAPWPERLRARLDRYYAKNFQAQEAGLLMAITTGERSMLDWRTRRSFGRCGLAHLISIAGMHFGIFSLCIFLLVRALLWSFPLKWLERMTLHISPAQTAALASFPLLSGYLLLSGMRVPAVRAFIMISFFLLGLLIGRRKAWQTTLAFAAFVLVLWRPDVIFDLSFELSFLSVLLIGLFVSGQEKKEEGEKEKAESERGGGKAMLHFIKKRAIRVIVLSFSITAGLTPLIAYYFHRVQLISPAANLAVVPVAGFLLVPVAVLSGFIYLFSGWYPLPFLSDWLAHASISMARFFSSIPRVCPRIAAFPAGFLLVFYGFLAAWLYSKRKVFIVLAVLPFAIWAGLHLYGGIFSASGGRGLDITFLDDGAGESAVAELPDGKTAVIDTGTDGRQTSEFLQYMGKNRIDYLVLSLARHDHTGGAAYLASRYRIGQIWDNGMLLLDRRAFPGIPEEKLSRGQYIEGSEGSGSYRITVLHPYAGFFPLRGPLSRAIDNSSLVLKIEDRWGKSALFAGDVSQAAQEDMLRLGGLLRCDVLKVPYNAGQTACWRSFIGAVRPAFAVVSKEDNHSGPGQQRAKALQALRDLGARVLETGTDGAVKASFYAKGVHIKTWKDMELREDPAGPGEELHNLRVLFSSW